MTFFLISMNWIYPFLAYKATNYFHKTSNAECSRYRTYRGTCITYFAMATGSTVDIYPKTIRMRFFLFMWLFYTYHLNMFFASTLVSFFAVEQHEPPLQTEEQLVLSDMQLGIDQRAFNYFTNYFYLHKQRRELSKNMTGKMIYCDSTSKCLSRIVQYR